jgi:hypothetical protein
MSKVQFRRFFSVDSPKAVKAEKFGYLNAINYMAPADTAGAGNLCPHASPGCLALCLGWYSGQAGIVSKATGARVGNNAARKSRAAKARLFMHDRAEFFGEMIQGIRRAKRQAARQGLKLCVRLNGATDIAWESVKIKGSHDSVVAMFEDVQFVDYTKSVKRALAHARGEFPANYHLTFSRSETNEADCHEVLAAGGNVAVVFAGAFPQTYLGRPVVDGDAHDLRHLEGKQGLVIALSPKGPKAKADKSGFVVRSQS